tara:strand:- start:4501 stop:4947 length:447 start_codon:yes stop_codon:yes gene_type:complete
MQKQQTNREIMGRLGEEALSAKYGFTLSDDKYDMEKDAIDENGNRVEIKTQNRHPAGYFTVNLANVNQLKKCVEVDRLLFLEYDNTDILKVWESPKTDEARRAKTIRTRDGRAMGGFPIDKMILIDELDDPDLCNMLKQLSQSKVIDV